MTTEGGRSRVAALTIVSMSWFPRFSPSLGLDRPTADHVVGWARAQLTELATGDASAPLAWSERASLEMARLRLGGHDLEPRAGLVVQLLDRVLAAESIELNPLNDWLEALDALIGRADVPGDARLAGLRPLLAMFEVRCPGGASALFRRIVVDDHDAWDIAHRHTWEPEYGLRTSDVWDGVHPPLVAALMLHDAPTSATSSAIAHQVSLAAPLDGRPPLSLRGWSEIRSMLDLPEG